MYLRRAAIMLGVAGVLAGGLLISPPSITPTSQSAAAATAVRAQPPGFFCQTPYGYCRLPYAAPQGASCYCSTPSGPIYGYVT